MSVLLDIVERAKVVCARIVLPEGEDPRVLAAAEQAQAAGIASIVLLGDVTKITNTAHACGLEVSGIDLIDPNRSDLINVYGEAYRALVPSGNA
jgi:phosphate acetyltransferase